MPKENRSTETAEQKERRLQQLEGCGISLCANDIRFHLLRQAARLSESAQRIFLAKVLELAEGEEREARNR